MRLVRAWPTKLRADRSRVEDDAERVPVDDYDYRALLDVDDNVIVLDYDIAAHREDLVEFAARAACQPDQALAAPYLIYPDTRPGLPRPTWSMRRYEPMGLRYIDREDTHCHLFGLGMTYLPRAAIQEFIHTHPGRILDDTGFAAWLWKTTQREVPITWDLRPVHLNYRMSTVAP